MRTLIFIILVDMLIMSGATAQTNHVPGKLIVSIKKEIPHAAPKKGSLNMGNEALNALNTRYGCKSIRTLMHAKTGLAAIYLLSFDSTADVLQLQRAYTASGMLRYAEPDYVAELAGSIPNDTLFGRQWGLNNDGSFPLATTIAGADIDMLRAWDVEDGDSSIIIGVIDSGVKTDHPEFDGRLWMNKHEIPNNDTDDDNNGFIDDVNGWNMVTDTNVVTDDNGHGTHVTGIIAANGNNTTGYAGLDRHCKLMICKVANASGLINYSWLIEGMVYAIDNGAQILNVSAGGYWPSAAFADIDDYAHTHNVTLVAAMGNNHSPAPFYPAACQHAIAVGATAPDDKATNFSNFGNHISVVAPGAFIYGLSHLYDTSYEVWYNGTSQAAPVVTGIAALLLAQKNNRTPADIKHLVESNAEDMIGDTLDKPGWDKYYGHGRVNAYRTLVNEELAIKDKPAPVLLYSIYPNPATDAIEIRSQKRGKLNIYNSTGQEVYNSLIQNTVQTIPLTGFSSGVYYVTLHSNGQQQTTQLVVR